MHAGTTDPAKEGAMPASWRALTMAKASSDDHPDQRPTVRAGEW